MNKGSAFKGFFDAAVDVANPCGHIDDDFAVQCDGKVFWLFERGVLGSNGDGHSGLLCHGGSPARRFGVALFILSSYLRDFGFY